MSAAAAAAAAVKVEPHARGAMSPPVPTAASSSTFGPSQQQVEPPSSSWAGKDDEEDDVHVPYLPMLKARFGYCFDKARAVWEASKATTAVKREAPNGEGEAPSTHVVFVVDGSSSMRTEDATGKNGQVVARYQAVFDCCRDFVRSQVRRWLMAWHGHET
jgi:hypothetical protein